jgi:hypothetical protein
VHVEDHVEPGLAGSLDHLAEPAQLSGGQASARFRLEPLAAERDLHEPDAARGQELERR